MDTLAEKIPGCLCPSAQPEWAGSVALGVVGGTADHPQLAYFEKPLPVTKDLLDLSGPVDATEVFRFAAPCMCRGCVHFEHVECQLVKKFVTLLPEVIDKLPECEIRASCRWWQQEGAPACFRCPQVVTKNHNPSVLMVQAATPSSECMEAQPR